MNHRELNPSFSVSPQISPDDIAAIKAAGFKSIICNRPDDEEPGQVPYAKVEAAAKAAGLPIANIPVVSGNITRQNAVDMKAALERLPKPVFAYCRSGARCANLYALTQQLPD